MEYKVVFTKIEIVEVEAENKYEAEEIACEILDNNVYAWSAPADKIEVFIK